MNRFCNEQTDGRKGYLSPDLKVGAVEVEAGFVLSEPTVYEEEDDF